MKGRKVLFMLLLSLVLVLGLATTVFASTPSIGEEVTTLFGTAGTEIRAAVFAVAGVGVGIFIALTCIKLSLKVFRTVSK